jgi:S1-C subfamily serine protease
MAITVACPSCGKTYKVLESQAGRHICPTCHTATTVPGRQANQPQAASAPAPSPKKHGAPVQPAAPTRANPPQPQTSYAPSPPSPPTRATTPIAPPNWNSLKGADKKSRPRKAPIGLIASGGIGLLVIIAGVAIAVVQLAHKPKVGNDTVVDTDPPKKDEPIPKPEVIIAKQPGSTEITKSDSPKRPDTVKPASRPPKGPEEIFDDCAPSVALIKGKIGSGSGFVVAPNLIATNSHVIRTEFGRNLEVHFPSASANDDKGPLHAEVVFEDAKRDLAFLAVRTRLPPLPVAQTFEFHAGMSITVIGSPGVGSGTLKNAISLGVLSTKDRIMDQDFYQIGASINPGNSGGPVFDKYGDVIGVATLKAVQQEGIAWCIPVEDLRSGIGRVTSQSAEAASDLGSRHRLQVVCRLLKIFGTQLEKGMAGYLHGMLDSRKKNQDPRVGLNEAAREIDPRLKRVEDTLTAIGLKDEIGEISANRSTDREAREQLFAIWETIQEIKSLLDRPPLPPEAFLDRASKLETNLTRQIETAQLRLGIRADED